MLARTRVLPSEHAGESHQLYVQAHTLAALAAVDARRFDEAYTHLQAALEWPAHLGQGRPYDPEERLVRFLMGRVEERRGRKEDARRSYEAVVAATSTDTRGVRRPDVLVIPALRALGRTQEAASRASVLAAAAPPELRDLALALGRGDLRASSTRALKDLDGELLVRALSVPSR
jgi:tetratricopeptide (TPR) repeat protein